MPEEKSKLLVIDDDESIRKVLTVTLQDAGYQVLAADNGEKGLEIFADEGPDIILCDLRMPGMDGISVLKEIKARAPDKEVIVISGYADMDLAVKALQLKAYYKTHKFHGSGSGPGKGRRKVGFNPGTPRVYGVD
jgi:DNA-binding NtrC family response regulator